jgi:hypothetical protein
MPRSAPGSSLLTRCSGEPRACYARWRKQLHGGEGLLLVDFTLDQYWLASAPPQALTAIYHVRDGALSLAVTDHRIVPDESLSVVEQYPDWVAHHQLLSVDPTRPLRLQAETVAKPWGREIWYTGVERRAVCHFADGEARVPIPWLQAALPAEAAGVPGQPLPLLKILDPSAQPVLGDLYFELHETKREVYVVTRVDRKAWPNGVGYIRYGFDPGQVARYPDHDQFRQAYLAAVTDYEAQRRAIDMLAAKGEAADATALEREQRLRWRMDRFTAMRPLREGDIVQVPLMLPHGLQHGVRVVEFQTATYERMILSFAQKVLTQDCWDTREAVSRMRLFPPDEVPRVPCDGAAGVRVEQIADFPDFEVQRVTMQPGRGWQPAAGADYRILTVLSGSLDAAGVICEPEQALLLPRCWRGVLAAPQGAQPLEFLLARPRC